jgi:hypothetical protein
MNNYIYTNANSLSPEMCNLIIENFENESEKYEGVTASGLNKTIKDTMDFNIPENNINEKNYKYKNWPKIHKLLESELNRNVKIYISQITNFINNGHKIENSKNKYQCFVNGYLTNDNFMIQRYLKNEGRYIYHDDFDVNWNNKQYRVITFLWYLNTVDEGGETELWCSYNIKPEAGKLLLFPSSWTFPHRGKMPISDNKYIITGWLYVHE